MPAENIRHEVQECEQRLRFETLLAELSSRFINLPADNVDSEIQDGQRRVCEHLGFDLSSLWQWDEESPTTFVLTHYYRGLDGPPVPEHMSAPENFPWSLAQLRAGRIVVVHSPESLPEEASRDAATYRHFGVRTGLSFPLTVGGGALFGAISFNDMQRERTWTENLIKRLALVAQVFGNAIARKRSEQALRESETRLKLATEAAEAGPWLYDPGHKRFWVAPTIMETFGLPPGDSLDRDRFVALVHPDDREHVLDVMAHAMQSQELSVVEYRILRPDGQVRWVASRGRMFTRGPGEPARFAGITSDITQRREQEADLRAALEEVCRLRERLQNENVYLREQILGAPGRGNIVGESEQIRKVLALARRVAATNSAVLITGETGTGKELLAQAIHDQSARRDKTMVKVNCAALPAPLIESELFGREKGAYTGAMTQQVGRFEIADGSTILLDEIGDLPLDLQGKLLRVLQDGEFERLGGRRTLKTNARLIAATNHDLAAMVRQGSFREDLFHRLNVFPIEVPPLRARAADIPLLVWEFVREFNTKMGRSVDSIPKPTMARLKQYRWPGNIRELRNVIERAMIVSEGRSLSVDLPEPGQVRGARPLTLEEVECRHILDVLGLAGWRISGKGGAADILGLVPTTLHSRMKKLGISRPKP